MPLDTVAFNGVGDPVQMVTSAPALTTGAGFTFTVPFAMAAWHGPEGPSGSMVVQVMVMGPPGFTAGGVKVALALVGLVKVPPPLEVHVPLLLVVATTVTVALLHTVYGPPTLAVAGAFTVRVAVADAGWHGPLLSGSLVVQVRVMVPGVALAGVKVVLVLVGFAKAPVPAGADQDPGPFALAWMFTACVPQVT